MKSSASRKFSIVAVFSVLAVVVMVNAFNQFQSVREATGQNKPDPVAESNEVKKTEVSERERESMANSLKTTLPGGGADGPEMAPMAKAGEKGAEFVNPDKATIYVTRMRIPEQQPNDSATSSQWYQEDARLKEKAAQMDKKDAVGAGG
jgi:hypothetical protein